MSDIAEVLKAVSKAMLGVKGIAKSGKNTHDNYNFASIDDFLAALNPICAEAGLVFHMQETAVEEFSRKGKYGDTAWLRMQFAITTYHVSGQHLPEVTRSVEVIRTGAQSYGSAQSYALKQFLRALLLVPTGDKDDADYQEKGDGPVDNSLRRAAGALKEDADRIAAEVRENTNAAAIIDALERCESEAEMIALWSGWNRDERRPLLLRPDVVKAKDAAKARLAQPSPFDGLEA